MRDRVLDLARVRRRRVLSREWAMHSAPPIRLYGSGQANVPSRRWNGRGHDTRRAPWRAHSVSPVAPPAWLIGRSNGSVGGSKGIAHSRDLPYPIFSVWGGS